MIDSIQVRYSTDEWRHSISPYILIIDGRPFSRRMTKDEVLRNVESYLEDMK